MVRQKVYHLCELHFFDGPRRLVRQPRWLGEHGLGDHCCNRRGRWVRCDLTRPRSRYQRANRDVALSHAGHLDALVRPLPAAGGVAVYNGVVPNNPGLIGLQVYMQTGIRDGSQPGGFGLSDGLQLTVFP